MANPWQKEPGREHEFLEELSFPQKRKTGPWEAAGVHEDYALDLLRRLEGDGPKTDERLAVPEEQVPEVLCPACQSTNPKFHRFCGFCGASLEGAFDLNRTGILRPQAAGSAAGQRPRPVKIGEAKPRGTAEPLGSFLPTPPVRETQPDKQQEDLNFLREQSFASFDSPPPSRRAWQYLAVLLLLGLAGFGYWKWSVLRQADVTEPAQESAAISQDRNQSAPASQNPAAQAEPPVPGSEQPSEAEPAQSKASTATAHQAGPDKPAAIAENRAPGTGAAHSPATAAGAPPSHDGRSLRNQAAQDRAAPGEAKPMANGAQELATAEHYLQGPNRNPAEAARWLWRATAKQNSEASLLLADLYLKGDGVGKSCEQGRLLLAAAAKKGVAGAAVRLRNLPAVGCQ